MQASASVETAIRSNAAEANVIIRFIAFKFKFTALDLARFRPHADNYFKLYIFAKSKGLNIYKNNFYEIEADNIRKAYPDTLTLNFSIDAKGVVSIEQVQNLDFPIIN